MVYVKSWCFPISSIFSSFFGLCDLSCIALYVLFVLFLHEVYLLMIALHTEAKLMAWDTGFHRLHGKRFIVWGVDRGIV